MTKKRILFRIPGLPRKELYVEEHISDEVKKQVNALIYAMKSGIQNIEAEEWIKRLPDVGIRNRLVKWGLVHEVNSQRSKTIEDLCEYVVQRKDITDSTIIKYRNSFNRLIGFFGRNKKLNMITEEDAQKYVEWLGLVKKLKPTSIHSDLNAVKSFFNDGWRMRWCEVNPFLCINYYCETNPERWLYVEAEDAVKVIRGIESIDNRVFIALMRFAGVRGGSEVYTMGWKNSIVWSEKGRVGHVIIQAEKTKKHAERKFRKVPMNPVLEECLREMWNGEEGLIFPGKDKYWNISKAVHREFDRCGVEIIRPYNLRRSFCSDMMEFVGCKDPKAYEMLCGHKFEVGMKHYQIMYKDRQDRAFEEVISGWNRKL